ncbi:uncharacterized protein [Euwallacea fornicatus]|uniref:uncharacterized protein n=1 Tax=Euwallacea fornicatus TaxID=995702 RepID=UPI00338FE948
MKLAVSLKQNITKQSLEALKHSFSKIITEAKPHIESIKKTQVKTLNWKLTQFNNWYMKLTGLDKVYLAQEKVTHLQGQLLNIQEKRRDVGRQLSQVRQKSMELQDDINKVKRQDDLEKFLDLMKKETEVLKVEKSISMTFQEYDQAERELFTAFTDSIRDSHEKQRAQMEYTKYFGVLLGMVSSFLTFMYSTLRKEQLKQIIDKKLQLVNDLHGVFTEQVTDSKKTLINEIVSNRASFSAFYDAVSKRLSIIENLCSQNRSKNIVDFIGEKSNGNSSDSWGYMPAVGVVLGLWMILKVLFG